MSFSSLTRAVTCWLALIVGVQAGLHRRANSGPGPSGSLLQPLDGTVWDNTYGLGLGQIVYQGVSQDYAQGDITHVTTQFIDIFLQSEHQTTTYYLARGINPNPSSLVVNESFAIPYTSGTYYLVINETQECQSPGLPPIVFQSAAPQIIIQSNSTGSRSSKRSLEADLDFEDMRLLARGGPAGTLNIPADGDTWNDANGFGSGRVQYDGVDQAYASGNITHVTTHTIDIWLETDDDSPKYFLARGIAPKNLVVDVNFQVPDFNGTYYLVVNETQECQSPELPVITFRSAAPSITILPDTEEYAGESANHSINVGAVIGGVVGGVILLAIIALVIFFLKRQKRRDDVELDTANPELSPLDPSVIATPFEISSTEAQPPAYSPEPQNDSQRSRYASTIGTSEFNRSSFASTAILSSATHARSGSGGSGSSYPEKPIFSSFSGNPPTSSTGTAYHGRGSLVLANADVQDSDTQPSNPRPNALQPVSEHMAEFRPGGGPVLSHYASQQSLVQSETSGQMQTPPLSMPLRHGYEPGEILPRQFQGQET